MNKEEEFEQAVTKVLELLGEDPKREGLLKTPSRVAKALKFLTEGYDQDPEEILNQALFTTSNDEMVLVRDIEFYSMCEHHMLPIIGRAHVAYIPDGKVVGLSKIPRIVNVDPPYCQCVCQTSADTRTNDRTDSRCHFRNY